MRVSSKTEASATRRDFLKTSAGALAAGAALESAIAARSYAGEDNTIKIALVGCGGRGTGAASQALSTKGPTKLVAMADVFADRLKGSLGQLTPQFSPQMDVPPDRQFLGMDAYKKAIDLIAPGGLVLLATPPAFRPMHVEYAVSKGCHVFMEKSFGVDAPGVRRILQAGEEAKKKNLKVAGGLMSRHYKPLEEAVEQIHKGAIGEVITCYAYRMHAPVGFGARRPARASWHTRSATTRTSPGSTAASCSTGSSTTSTSAAGSRAPGPSRARVKAAGRCARRPISCLITTWSNTRSPTAPG